ncbi:MAG: exodeoxyribonuclease VII small subunit [Sphingobacterium sp.]|uniref:exodeoxyribonuclease VII small subunit n=1 Tax=Sphingobacterium sp. JB170 TaxID=1434842 RepID=UPI00097F25D8|nr:exodeoxyribonuclease VII small subunit [Sphingobacterium sp. JB170]SJN42305.1 hypothetical protein FM107_11525 [Sphingobacterium sp. JB170]
MDKNYTYSQALEELQLIVDEIESGKTDIDELTTKIRRAASLINVCKAKLSSSEQEVEKLLEELEEDEQEPSED